MLRLFKKKEISLKKLANIFVNYSMQMVDSAFRDVAECINNDPEFVPKPNISGRDGNKFLMIVIAANLSNLPKSLDKTKNQKLKELIFGKFSTALKIDKNEFKQKRQKEKG